MSRTTFNNVFGIVNSRALTGAAAGTSHIQELQHRGRTKASEVTAKENTASDRTPTGANIMLDGLLTGHGPVRPPDDYIDHDEFMGAEIERLHDQDF